MISITEILLNGSHDVTNLLLEKFERDGTLKINKHFDFSGLCEEEITQIVIEYVEDDNICYENQNLLDNKLLNSMTTPVNLNFRYDYNYRKPEISWQFPLNIQRDIVKFQIFKRQSKVQGGKSISAISQPFTLVAEYDFDQSIIKSAPLENVPTKNVIKMEAPRVAYIDGEFQEGEEPIYALAAIDAHGMTSPYSAQFQIKYDKMRNKITKKLISKSGAPKPYPNIYVNKDTFQDLMKTSAKDRMTIVFDPEYYQVVKTLESAGKGAKQDGPSEIDLKLIAIDKSAPTYKIQIINTDLQQSEVIDISVTDHVSQNLSVPAAKISKSNLSFEFGITTD